jgi:hypothetical protein
MIWTPTRNAAQGLLVAEVYGQAGDVPCERSSIMAGGLRGADKDGALAQAGVDRARYLTISVDRVLEEMAARDLIPHITGLSPMEAADLGHAEAQFLAKRLALRALTDGRNLLWDITMASRPAIESWLAALKLAGFTTSAVFVDIGIEESVRRSDALHRAGHEDYRYGYGYGGRYVPPAAIRALADTEAAQPGSQESVRSSAEPVVPVVLRSPSAEFPASPVLRLIRLHHGGELPLEELAREFRVLHWQEVPPTCPPGLEAAAPAIDDPEPYVPGSFDDVIRAYDLGMLSDDEYAALAPAVARALRERRLTSPAAAGGAVWGGEASSAPGCMP